MFGFKPFTGGHYRSAVSQLADVALQTADKGIVLATTLVESLRNRTVSLPALAVIERVCSQATARASRRIYGTLSDDLPPEDGRFRPLRRVSYS